MGSRTFPTLSLRLVRVHDGAVEIWHVHLELHLRVVCERSVSPWQLSRYARRGSSRAWPRNDMRNALLINAYNHNNYKQRYPGTQVPGLYDRVNHAKYFSKTTSIIHVYNHVLLVKQNVDPKCGPNSPGSMCCPCSHLHGSIGPAESAPTRVEASTERAEC